MPAKGLCFKYYQDDHIFTLPQYMILTLYNGENVKYKPWLCGPRISLINQAEIFFPIHILVARSHKISQPENLMKASH